MTLRNQPGQVGVIIVLIMSVLMTVGLSLAANTSKDVVTTTQEEESNRVFNAAEAGVEEALSGDLNFQGESTSGTVDTINDVDVDFDITKLRSVETRLFEGLSVGVDVTGVTDGQVLRVDFSRESDCGTQDIASILISIYYDDAGTTRVRHLTLDGCNRNTNFAQATVINENGYFRRRDVALETGDMFVRIKPLYADTHVRITSVGWQMPVQGYAVRSQAASQNGNETRIVQVNRTLPAAPSIFDYALYSGTSIVK